LLASGIIALIAVVPGCAPLSVARGVPDDLAPGIAEESEPRVAGDEKVEPLPAPRPFEEEALPSRPAELPEEVDEGPPNGLTLEAAIEQLLQNNTDLAARFQDIPKARADVLSAGLRNDPVVFLSAAPVSYGRFSPQRPGATTYDITIVQSLDVNGKHKINTLVARQMIPILEARYQDAARLQIDALYTAYVDVLEARAARAAARANLEQLAEAVEKTRELVQQGRRTKADVTWASLRQANAQLALRRTEATLRHARRNLAVLLAIPAEEADCLLVCGPLRDRFPPPPCTEELIRIALQTRPDLIAHQLSVKRAQAEVRRARAEGLDDLFLFFSPFQINNLSPQDKSSTAAWEFGILLPIPILDRNQGEIARARANVAQWRMEVDRAEQEVIDEVRQAATEYAASRENVQRYERELLTQARSLREEKYRQFASGEKDLGSFLTAQRRYEEIVREYLETLTRHRRDMLRLNTAVGQRILP
jgi:cobalt-zinc-cadmium efflux system outer membrane protein